LIVKYVPEWFPGATFQREAREWKKSAAAMMREPYEAVKTAMVSKLGTNVALTLIYTPHITEARHSETIHDKFLTGGPRRNPIRKRGVLSYECRWNGI
jgi:hypothetical protein